jgi:hypothetical protein
MPLVMPRSTAKLRKKLKKIYKNKKDCQFGQNYSYFSIIDSNKEKMFFELK